MSTYAAPAIPPANAVSALHDEEGNRPRLPPILRPRSWKVRLLAALVRRQLGKVISAITVIYARMPRLLFPQALMVRLVQKGLSFDSSLADLVQIRVSVAHGCTFCTDLHRATALREGRDPAKLRAVLDPDLGGAKGLTEKETVALALADEMARGALTDATFHRARALFDERGVVELVWLCSFTGYLNSMARALRMGSDELSALVPKR